MKKLIQTLMFCSMSAAVLAAGPLKNLGQAEEEAWCAQTFIYWERYRDEVRNLQGYAINQERAEDYVLNAAVAENLHDELAEFCFYGVKN